MDDALVGKSDVEGSLGKHLRLQYVSQQARGEEMRCTLQLRSLP